MATPISIEVGNLTLAAELSDTPTAKAIAKALPIEAEFATWGDEYYFEIPVKMPADDTATTEVDVGDLGYWPQGRCFAIFYGPTPASPTNSDRPVPASEVNPIGRVLDDVTLLRVVAGVGQIRVTKAKRQRAKDKD